MNLYKLKIDIKKIVLLGGILSLCSSCLVSRLRRPEITGTIVDYNYKPIINCKVGGTLTDSTGYFKLKEKRYLEFVPIIALEAPPLMVFETIDKEGFLKEEIYMFNRFGGGQRKGAKAPMDTIFLKRKDQQFDLKKILTNTWEVSYSKTLDTLYLMRKELNAKCKINRCKAFNYHKFWYNKALPKDINSMHITMQIDEIKTFIAKKITKYKGSSKPVDSITVLGKWELDTQNEKVSFLSKIPEFNTNYKFVEIDKFYITMVKEHPKN